MVFQSITPTRSTECSVRVWAWFNFNAKSATPLVNCIRQITNMSEDEFLEVVNESLLPQTTARFKRSSVTFLKDFYLFAIPPSVYEWFEDYKVDQFPPKSRYLSPFASLLCSIEWSINKDLRLIRGNADKMWESIEIVWSSKSLCIDLWKQNIENLKDKITSIVEGKEAP